MPHGGDHDRDWQERDQNRRVFENYDQPPGDLDPRWNDVTQGLPLFDLDAADRDAVQQWRNQQIWTRVAEVAPTVGELSTDLFTEGTTDEYGDLLMGASELEGMNQGQQQAAMAQLAGVGADLHQISEGGGYTPQDRAQMTAQRLRQGQALSGANAAAMQQMQARGTGGGGAELASRLGGSAAYANANAQADAAIGAAGQQRAMQALQAQGQIGQAQGQIAGQMYGQDAQRREALDRYNQSQYDWRRGRGERNTERQYRQSRDRADAYQQAHGNRMGAASGYAGHNPYGDDGNSGAEDNALDLGGAILSNL